MKTLVKIILSIITIVGLCGFYEEYTAKPMNVQQIKNLPKYNRLDISRNSPAKREPLIGLYESGHSGFSKTERFHCSATVISDTLALTAAHCLYNDKYFMKTGKFIIKDYYFNPTGVTAKPAAMNVAADLGLITGDFRGFNKLPVATGPGGVFSITGPVVSCGFPWGDKPICTPFIDRANLEFGEEGTGRLYPGMSGGPTVDINTGSIIAVNSGVVEGGTVVAPTVGIFGALGLQEEL